MGGRDMKNANSAGCDPFTDEMKVDFNMFGTLGLHWVRGKIDNTQIVAENYSSARKR